MDPGAIPEDMIEVRRDTMMVGLGLYVSALVGLYLFERPVDPDPASFKGPWEIVFFGTAAAILLWLHVIIQRWREGRPWRQILGFTFAKPFWWVGWYPSRLRHPGDVWSRLPADLRLARTAVWAFVLAWLTIMPAQVIILSGDDTYRKTGQRPPIQRVMAEVPRDMVFFAGRAAGLGILVLMASLLLFTLRWGRTVRRSKSNRRLTNAMFFQDTGHRSFWLKPDVAVLLQPAESPKGQTASAPTSAPELAQTVAEVCRSLAPSSGIRNDAAEAACALAASIAALDAEIASLSASVDPAERERLESRLAALGPAPPSEDVGRRQMRDLLQKQFDLLRGFESRLGSLKAGRAKRLDLLRALWLQAVDLRAAANDPAKEGPATGRIRALCAEITQHLNGAGTNPTAAISDAPTIERT